MEMLFHSITFLCADKIEGPYVILCGFIDCYVLFLYIEVNKLK